MRRLRHPVRAIREPFGTAGLIVACLALVAAVGGTALAATKLNSTQKKEVEKIAKKFAGKPGASGAAGPAGPAGAPGAKGDAGTPGAPGGAGTTGPTGKNGTNGTNGAPGATGPTGPTGETGFTETLPSGKTETGTWSAVGFYLPNEKAPFGTISYSIPLKEPSETVKYLNLKETEESVGKGGCELELNNPAAKPKAPKGTLCIFTREELAGEVKLIGENGSDTVSGTVLLVQGVELSAETAASALAGTWAVTAK